MGREITGIDLAMLAVTNASTIICEAKGVLSQFCTAVGIQVSSSKQYGQRYSYYSPLKAKNIAYLIYSQ